MIGRTDSAMLSVNGRISRHMWFEELMGFKEESPEQVRERISVSGPVLTSSSNGRSYRCGRLQIRSLGALRQDVRDAAVPCTGRLTLREIVADVQDLHADPSNTGALFQVASQFNLLEMTGPDVLPEMGVGIYEYDRTQGPACAIACGAGTIFRNYFVEVNGRTGQSAGNQIDCLAALGDALDNSGDRLWTMSNGYALPSQAGLHEIHDRLVSADETELDVLRQCLRIGIQQDAQVTLRGRSHAVSQAYCSALPVAYSRLPSTVWEPFARLVLDAAYEATFCAAVLNALQTGSSRLFLTLLGGGAFGNNTEWIIDAVRRAVDRYRNAPLDVAIVSYGSSHPAVKRLVREALS